MLVSLPIVFLLLLVICVFSALLLLCPKVPLNFVRIHVGLLSLPSMVALLALISNSRDIMIGPFHFDSLSWLLALFVLTIGLIVQRYSIRYLLGDRSYRKYFALLTITLVADSVAWLSDDLRLLLVCWGVTLLGLTLLVGLNRGWQVARVAAVRSGRLLAIGWLILLVAIIWVAQATGYWELSLVLAPSSLAHLGSWEKTCINLLLIAAVIIPAAQWPFQRWLLDSVVAPTPVSAVMHAGIVNAGGMMLTRFAPLISGDTAQMVLLVLSSISVLIGTGMMLVQVDYKRQLVGSTIAQMGFMLIQCALGAFLAAIIHAVLHGIFKSSLFLQAGSAIRHNETKSRTMNASPLLIVTGGILGILVGVGFWLTSTREPYQLISAFILGWSVSLAWTQLVALGYGRIGRIVGFAFFIGAAVVYIFIHNAFYRLLHETVQEGMQAPILTGVFLLSILLGGSVIGLWLVRNRTSSFFAVIYLWLIRLSEPKSELIESHPEYLTQIMSRGGHLR